MSASEKLLHKGAPPSYVPYSLVKYLFQVLIQFKESEATEGNRAYANEPTQNAYIPAAVL